MAPSLISFPKIDPVALNLFGLKVHWYALMYLLGFLLGWLVMRARLKQEPFRSITKPSKWTELDISDLLLYSIVGVVAGGRLGYVIFYQPGHYLAQPLDVFRLWDGGMSFHGGALGVIAGIALYAWQKKRPFLQVGDFLVPAVPLGLAAGRVGNFINGELWGRPASAELPWAMVFPTGGDIPRHPSQLYQALLEGLALFVILWLYARKARYRGQVAAVFLAGYGVFRFVVEFWREPDSFLGFLGLGLTMGQWLSVPMVVVGVGLWLWSQQRGITDVEEPDALCELSEEDDGEEPFASPTAATPETPAEETLDNAPQQQD